MLAKPPVALSPLSTLRALTPLAKRLDNILPQTQCQRCGYPSCAGYAQAIVDAGAAINRCPPGGAAGIEALAELTGRDAQALDPECGAEGPLLAAWIDPKVCIGCTLCVQACPVDAIVGANQTLHGVIETECSGCELCVPVCPVDCIVMKASAIPVSLPVPQATRDIWRARHAAHLERYWNAVDESIDDAGFDAANAAAAALARARAKHS